MIISFTVDGCPSPKAYGANARGWYIGKAAKDWEKAVANSAMIAARQANPSFVLGEWVGEVHLTMIFWLPIPASEKKIKPGMPHIRKSKGDGANLYKSTEDALKRILFADDGQVSQATWYKFYAEEPHVDVKVELL